MHDVNEFTSICCVNPAVQNCLGVEDDAYTPEYGFYCMNTDQRGPNSKCMTNPTCQQDKYMTSQCQCPDFQVRYFCQTPSAKRQKFCDDVVSSYEERKKGGKRKIKKFMSDSSSEVRDSAPEVKVDTAEHNLLEMLKKLLMKKNLRV